MRKELAIGEVAYNIQGKAMEVVKQSPFGDGWSDCGGCHREGASSCGGVRCHRGNRKDQTPIIFQRRQFLDRDPPRLGVFTTPSGKRWEVVKFSGKCEDCDFFEKPGCEKFNCFVDTLPDSRPQMSVRRRKDLEKDDDD